MYSIRQVAELTGFSPDTLRYYEKIGLVQSPKRFSQLDPSTWRAL